MQIPQVVVMQDHGGSPKKGPTCSMSTLGSLVLLEEPRAQERPLSVGRCRPGEAAVLLAGSCPSYPSAAPLSSRIFFSGVLFMSSLLVLLATGNEVRNDLCRHLSDHLSYYCFKPVSL